MGEARKMGRPKLINAEVFEKLCEMMCTKQEICAFFDASTYTVDRFCKSEYECSFKEAYEKFSMIGHVSLRRAQFISAVDKGNVNMQMFLGKNYLDQSDSKNSKSVDNDLARAQAEKIRIENEINQEKLKLLQQANGATTEEKLDNLFKALTDGLENTPTVKQPPKEAERVE